MGLVIMGAAIVGASVLLRLGTHRGVIGAAEMPAVTSAASPAGAISGAQTEIVPDSKPTTGFGIITFEAPTVHASSVQSLVALTVRRVQAKHSRGAFVWRVERGSASPGVDYEHVAPRLVRFIEGQTVRTLFIPLISSHATATQHGSRTFTVALEQVAGGPTLGRFARVTVNIDPSPPANTYAYQARAGY